jgi:DUF1680 family protein
MRVVVDPPGAALYPDVPAGLEAFSARLIPYCAWANRGEGEMSVFLRSL